MYFYSILSIEVKFSNDAAVEFRLAHNIRTHTLGIPSVSYD